MTKPMRFPAFVALVFLFAAAAKGQDPMFPRLDFPIQQNGQSLAYAFAGGLNAPQFNAADLNHDGIQDLVIFDRTGDVVLTFLNNGAPGQTDYVFAPEYACFFPKLVEYVLLRDYNQDGAADIFCSSLQPSSQEMQVFRGYYENNTLKFTPFLFSYASCPACDPRYIWYPDEIPDLWNNLPISKTDYPAVDDIDGDGDLDIVCFEASLSTSMFYLRNKSVELGFGLDSLKFELVDKCFGRFTENGLEACRACLSPDGSACCQFAAPTADAEERSNRHPGSTAMAYDKDGDGDKELVLGNISHECLIGLTNGGTPTQAWMTEQDTLFPSYDTPVDLTVFPASFYLDINNDGKKDLVVAPNSKNIVEDRKGVWYYENTAPAGGHFFELATKTLIVGDMADVGSTSHPAVADVNGDGLPDIVVGNWGFYTSSTANNSSLQLFLNTGTASQPAFTLADTDWQGLSEFAPDNYDFAPAFGDLDGDGDLDLLVGTYIGGLFCYFNEAGAGNPMQLTRDLDPMWYNMDVGISSVPVIYDLDGDNRPDVLLGERNGNVNFFKNNGSPTEPVFAGVPTIDKLGKLDARVFPDLIGHSTPVLALTGNGLLLVMGTQNGHYEAYEATGATSDSFPQLSASWGNIDDGFRSHPALADLDNDGVLEVVTGNQRGGLSVYGTTLVDCSVAVQAPVVPDFQLTLSPNPARDLVRAQTRAGQAAQWRVFNLLGQPISAGNTADGRFEFSVKNWPPGVYFVEINTGKQRATAKLLVK